MAEKRADRIERLLRASGGRIRLQELLDKLRTEEDYSDLSYQSVYMAIQLSNQRQVELGERPRFITSREGEGRGWVRLREDSDFAKGSAANKLAAEIHANNESIGDDIRNWLERMDWRTFESTFLAKILEALGFQDVEITQATRDGGVDARVVYRRGIVSSRAIISAKRWTSKTVPVDEVQRLRGLKVDEDTAIIVTTGRFSQDAKEEAKPAANLRIVYLIDGDMLIDICKRNQIGVKKAALPELLILDPEVTRDSEGGDAEEDESPVSYNSRTPTDGLGLRRLRDEMLGNPERGLSAEEIAEFTGYKINTVRVYLCDEQKKKMLGDKIRGDEYARARALQIVTQRRGEDGRE